MLVYKSQYRPQKFSPGTADLTITKDFLELEIISDKLITHCSFFFRFGLNIVGTTSIASQSSKSLLKDSNRNLNTRPKFTFKSSSFESNTTIIKKGYNGLGGQSKFLMPASKRPCGKVKIPKSSKASNTKRINNFMKKSPPLPNFFHSPQ